MFVIPRLYVEPQNRPRLYVEPQNRITFCDVRKYTKHMWGSRKLARQVSTLEVAADILLLCAAAEDASDFPPVVLRHTEGTLCQLSREFRSSPDEPQLG